MRIVFQDETHTIEVHPNRSVWHSIDRDDLVTSYWYAPEEAVEVAHALLAAGAEAGGQCCAEGCTNPATEFPEDSRFDG